MKIASSELEHLREEVRNCHQIIKDLQIKREWVGLTEQDMPSGEDPMFDHQYFIAGMVYAANLLKEKNT